MVTGEVYLVNIKIPPKKEIIVFKYGDIIPSKKVIGVSGGRVFSLENPDTCNIT